MMAKSINYGVPHSIADLGPDSNNWVITVRVMRKTPIRMWQDGRGNLFSMVLMDKTGEIRGVVFTEYTEKYYKMIEVNKVYFISKCEIQSANPDYNVLNSFYELIFTQETQIVPCEDAGDIPDIQCAFSTISKIANMEPKAVVDVIGVCTDTGRLRNVTKKETDQNFDIREITLVDDTDVNIPLRLWNDEAFNFAVREGDIILVKGARLTDYDEEIFLTCYFESILKLNPDIPEAHKLRGWYNKVYVENTSASVSDISDEVDEIDDADEKKLGLEIKPGYS